MRGRVVLVLVFALALFGCKRGSPKLQGRWRGTRADGVSAEVRGQADKWAQTVEVEFKGDVMTVTTPSGTATSKYKVTKEDKGSVTLVTEADATEESLAFESDTTLKWTAPQGKTLTLTKQ